MDNNPLIIESKEILDPELIPKYINQLKNKWLCFKIVLKLA